LLFFKRLSHLSEEEYQALLKKYKDEDVAKRRFHRFTLPEECLWSGIRIITQNEGQKLNDALAKIAKTKSLLEGVIS